MQRFISAFIALVCACSSWGQSADAGLGASGKLRAQWDERDANPAGPLAQANALRGGTAALPASGATLEAELRSAGRGWNAIATLQQRTGQASGQRAWFNELAAALDAGSWQFSAGKKIVAWDVAYAFRPNDMVQQEERRTLVSSTAEGRPVLMAELFEADRAWSVVLVNPTQPKAAPGAQEPAFAARVYQRQGAADWHGFARIGAHTAGSVGGALAWVANDALELHGSVRYLSRYDGKALDPHATGLVRSDPWHATTQSHAAQALIGGTWTHASQLSLLLEAWWDGTALSARQWRDWRTREQMLVALAAHGAPADAVAGNLAWQADALGVSPSLQRGNLFVRLSWEHEGWQPTLDLLYQPADRGRMLTAALLWKGDRVQVQGALRMLGGPSTAVLARLPQRTQAIAAVSWAF